MSPERGESWWQPPKQFDEPAPPIDDVDEPDEVDVSLHRASWDDPADDADDRDAVLDLDDELGAELDDGPDERDDDRSDDEDELLDRYDDEFLDDLDDSEPTDADEDVPLVEDVDDLDDEVGPDDWDASASEELDDEDDLAEDDLADDDIVETDLEDVEDLEELDEYPTEDTRSFAGWTAPTTTTTPKEGLSNRAFALGVVLIVLATLLGVAIALSFDSSNDRSKDAPTSTSTAPTEVRSETTVRSSTEDACDAEQARLEQAEFDYELGSTNHAYTDVHGLLESKKLDKAPTMLTITNARPANPPTVEWAGHVGKEFLDYEIHPIAGGPCDPTTPG
jgi:hypothetical protein